MSKQKNKQDRRHRSKKQAVIMLAAGTTILWLVLVLVKILVSYNNGEPLDFMDILNGIADNILGILPPIILIDFAFEYVTQDYVSEEISEQITGTLMSNPDTIRLFEEDTRRNFLNATIDSMAKHGPLEEEMAENAIGPYLRGAFNLRKNFHYTITLRDKPVSSLFDPATYITINEKLCFEKYYIKDAPLGADFGIGFFMENKELDSQLRDQTLLMQENLSIRSEELQALCDLPDDAAKRRFITEDMRVQAWINGELCDITEVIFTKSGILVRFHSDHKVEQNMISVEISFLMPQLKTEKTFQAVIADPTYNVYIRLDYPTNYRVKMYPFFNGVDDARVKDADHGGGSCDIHLRNKWVYPRSGAVFYMEEL